MFEPYEDITLLHRGRNVSVYRARRNRDGTRVVLKVLTQGTAGRSSSRLASEAHILEHLAGTPGIPKLCHHDMDHDGELLEVVDIGGGSLRVLLPRTPYAVPAFIDLGLKIARICAAIHAANIVHREIMPENIVYNPTTGATEIVDFGKATFLSHEKQTYLEPGIVEGWLAYISPEQTGRINRTVDLRTDLYSLGVTFYEMLTGRLPFTSTDPKDLIYSHIARQAQPPHLIQPDVPVALSHIVEKLLAKNAADRYQSAAGLIVDLEKCRHSLSDVGYIADFAVGQNDFAASLSFPEKLYGRVHELNELHAACADISAGGTELLLLSGYAGVGKSMLAHEIQGPITAFGGMFASCKFDQNRRDTPSAVVTSSFRPVLRRIMTLPESDLASWKCDFTSGLGSDAPLLMDVLPELGLLLEISGSASNHDAGEGRKSFRHAFLQLVRVLATRSHPLVLLLDDMQCADPLSLDLVEMLLNDTDIGALLIIGTYRDNEVDTGHAALSRFSRLERQGGVVRHLVLAGLDQDDTAQMVADCLHCSSDAAQELAAYLVRRTAGNPLFVRQLLQALEAENLLTVEASDSQWHWDLEAISGRGGLADNVVDLLIGRLRKMRTETQQLIGSAACVGNSFDPVMVAALTGMEANATAESLNSLVGKGFLHCVSSGDRPEDLEFVFSHDRVQQAASALLPSDTQYELHVSIARRLEAGGMARTPDQLLAVVEHYVTGLGAIRDPYECRHVAGLLLRAAGDAIEGNLYAAAHRFTSSALGLMDTGTWETATRATCISILHASLCGLGRLDEADPVYARFEALPVDLLSRTEIVCAQAVSLCSRMRYAEGVALGLRFLDQLDYHIDVESLDTIIARELGQFDAHVAAGVLEQPLRLATMREPVALAAHAVMSRIRTAALFHVPKMAFALSLHVTNYCFAEGWNELSLTSAVSTFMALVSLRDDYKTPGRLADNVLSVISELPPSADAGRQYHIYALAICHWSKPLQEDIEYARKARAMLLDHFDHEFACYATIAPQTALLESAASLTRLEDETAQSLALADRYQNRHTRSIALVFRQLARTLRGKTASPGSFDDDDFTEDEHRRSIEHSGMARAYYLLYRSLAAALFDDWSACLGFTEQAQAVLPYIAGFYPTALYRFLHSIAACRRMQDKDVPAGERAALSEQIVADRAWLSRRAIDAPENFAHLVRLVEAEQQSDTNFEGAARAYEESIVLAELQVRPWHSALACKCAARFYRRHGILGAAAAYQRKAEAAYASWGATALCSESGNSGRRLPRSSRDPGAFPSTGIFDLEAVMQASQVLASDLELDSLVPKVMHIVLTTAGADRAVLLRCADGDQLVAIGISETDLSGVHIVSPPQDSADVDLPHQILNLARRTGETVLVDEACQDSEFSQDAYIQREQPQSVLCIPFTRSGSCAGLLYLENRLVSEAFTEARVRVLQALATHIAISIENAELFRRAQDELAERKRIEAKLLTLNKNLSLATQVATIGIWDRDLRTNLTIWDDRMFALYAVRRVPAMQHERWKMLVHPDDLQSTLRAMQNVVDGKAQGPYQFRIVHSDGSIRHILATAGSIRNAEGQAVRLVGVNLDVTQRVKDAGELKVHKEQLEEIVRLRTAELIAARDEARSASRAKSIFLANMSHEIRTPLNAIIGFSELMSRDGLLPSESRRNVDTIRRSGEHLLELINDILDLAKVEAGRFTLEPRPFDLVRLLGDLETLTHGRAVAKGLSLTFAVSPVVPRFIEADERRLRQVLLNLLGNAVKFTSNGAILLRADAEYSDEQAWLTVSIEDTGPGIPQEDQGVVFQAFVQTLAGRRASQGTGLGLAISHEFAYLMGGELTLASEPGKGSCFTLRIPVQPSVESALSVPDPIMVVGLAPGQPEVRVLVVDDRGTNRDLLRSLLSRIGFRVFEAVSGQEAIDRFVEVQPHLVLMDIVMPDVDGLEATRRIRALDTRAPIIAVSASTLEEDVAGVLQSGANGFIRKPFHANEILLEIARHVEVRYLYETEEAPAEPDRELVSFSAVPDALRQRLRSAATVLDSKAFAAAIAGVEQIDPSLATWLRQKASGYAYHEVLMAEAAGEVVSEGGEQSREAHS